MGPPAQGLGEGREFVEELRLGAHGEQGQGLAAPVQYLIEEPGVQDQLPVAQV